MSTVINKTPSEEGIYRYLTNIDITKYSSSDWLLDPNVTALVNVKQDYWKVTGSVVEEMTGGEKTLVDAAIRDRSATPNNHGEFKFGNRGITINRWLRTESYFMPSFRMPQVFLSSGYLTGLTFLNYVDSVDTDIQLYKNGTLWTTWEIRSKRYAYKTNKLIDFTFKEGDQLSVRCKGVGNSRPTQVLVTTQYKYDILNTNDSGSGSI
jgi:hypothetical protein